MLALMPLPGYAADAGHGLAQFGSDTACAPPLRGALDEAMPAGVQWRQTGLARRGAPLAPQCAGSCCHD